MVAGEKDTPEVSVPGPERIAVVDGPGRGGVDVRHAGGTSPAAPTAPAAGAASVAAPITQTGTLSVAMAAVTARSGPPVRLGRP